MGQWSSATGRFGIAGANSVPQHIVRLIKDTELYGRPQRASTLPKRVPLVASPRTPLDHDELSKLEEPPSELPLELLDQRPSSLIEDIDVERSHPLIRTEADGAVFDFESPPEGRLPRPGKATDDHEPPGMPGLLLDPVGLGCLDEANCVHMRRPLEPGLGDPVPAVHEMAVSGEDDRIGQVRRVDEPSMLCDGTTGRWSVSEPAVPVEVGDAGDLDELDWEVARQAP